MRSIYLLARTTSHPDRIFLRVDLRLPTLVE
jgi:hypothetical protein